MYRFGYGGFFFVSLLTKAEIGVSRSPSVSSIVFSLFVSTFDTMVIYGSSTGNGLILTVTGDLT